MDHPTPAARGRTGLRRLARVASLGVIPLIATALLTTCSDTPTAPNRPGFGSVAVEGILPSLQLPPNLTLDHVHLVVQRRPATTLLDKTYPFDISSQQLIISAQLLLQAPAESLIVRIDYLSQTTVLFSGTDTLLVHQGPPGSNPSVQIQTAYVGPGTNVAAITIQPRDTILTFGDDLLFRVSGEDVEGLPVESFYVTWTSSDPQQIVNGAGSLHAAAKRGAITITATTPGTLAAPGGIIDRTTITILPAATALDLSAGDNQTGAVGTQLEQQLAVVVKGADNLPVPGTVVTFAAKTGGGSVDSLTATSDLNGIARSDATLGPATGSQTFVARLGTLDSVTFTATATGIISTLPVPVVAGQDHSCALMAGGVTLCWGDNSKGQIGDGTNLSQASPRAVAGGNVFVSLAAGGAHSCGIAASGQAFCWGDNAASQLGDGSITPSLTPKAVSGGLSFSQLSAGTNYTCGLTTTGLAYCWGSNAHGNLGDGSSTPRNVPTAVSGGLTFAAITVGGDNHTCALTGGGQAYCWGYNLDGELGDGSTTDRPVPTAVAGGHVFKAISAGSFHTCAIEVSGAAFCWGDNNVRQLGDGSIGDQPIPVAVQGALSFAALSAGGGHTCAFTAAGAGFCWGANGAGQIGDDGTTTALQPVQISGGLTLNAIAAGGNHSCGRDVSGALYCWGENNNAEVGDGTTTNQPAPVAVLQGGGTAATLAVNQGDGLTAAPGGSITPVPCVVITDVNGLPVQGVTVTFAVATGNGSITGPSVVSDAAGIGCVGSWTLGPLPGSNTLTATATGTGISGNPLTFTATALIVGLRTWTGAVSTLWTTAGNWSPNTVPGLTESVVIPFTGISNFPVLGAAGFANDLTIAAGATLTITGANVLTVNGNVDLSGTLSAANGSVNLGGAGKTLQGTLNASSATISGSYALSGNLSSNGGLGVVGSSASLTLGGSTATISGAFATSGGGVLIMTNAAANLNVGGIATFGGGDETGKLTAGTLTLGAAFDQTGPIVTSFVASGTHHTVLQNPNGQQTVTFTNPGPSGFGTLQVLTTFGVHLGSNVIAASDVTVNGIGIGGNLLLDGHTLIVGGNFSVSQSGKISMVLAADSLLVAGDASFGGADENGRLSDGVLRVGGNLSQTGPTPTSFTATGSHKTVLDAAATRTVTFENPGASGATSRFQDLDVAGATGGLTLASDLFVGGQLSSKPSSGTPRLVGGGGTRTITAVGVDVTSLVFDNVLLVINGGTIDLFDNISFQNTPATGTALIVDNPGRATPFVFSNLVFGSTPTSGFYLQANDNTVGDGLTLTLNLINPTPATPGRFVSLLNGAVVNWPGVIPLRTWSGALSTDWFNPGNWSPLGVPGAGEDVSVPNVATLPVLTATGAAVQNLIGISGASLGLAGFDLTVSGDADWQGTMSSTGGAIVLAGGARTINGTFAALAVNGSYTLAGPTAVSGNVTVNAGSLILAGETLTVGGTFQTVGSGTVTMTNAADQLTVSGTTIYSGGDETGKLTAGTMRVGGDFTVGGAGTAFVASGTHTTIVNGGAAQAINTPFSGTQFQTMEIANTAGGVTLVNSLTVAGTVNLTTASSVTGAGTLTTPTLSSVAGSNFGPAGLNVAGALNVLGTYAVGTTTFTGGTTLPVLAYQNLVINVPATMALSGATAVAGGLDVGGGSLNLSGQILSVGGAFRTLGSGTVTMANAADQFNIAGAATFGGGNETGKLTAGTLRVGGDFSVGGAGTAFVASGTHTTIVNGTAAQAINSPFTGTQFQTLQIANTAGGVSLVNSLTVAGAVSVTTATSVTGAGTLTTPSLTTVAGGSFSPTGLSTDASGLTVAGSYGVSNTTFTGGTTLPILAYQNLVISVPTTIALSGATTLTGNINVTSGSLNLGGQALSVSGALQTQGSGTITMTNAAGQLTVAGAATFGGGDETGKLTAGTLRVGGDFTVAGAGTAFVASGSHTTIVDGTVAQSITAPFTGSQFQNLQVTNTAAPVSLANNVVAAGEFTAANSAIRINGGGNALSVAGLAVTGLTLDNVIFTLDATTGAAEAFDNVTFQNYATSATQFTVNHPGLTTGALTFTNLTFTTQPTTGFYVSANDITMSTGGILSVSITSSGTPSATLGNSRTQVLNGALVNWGLVGGPPSWNGLLSTDWSTAGNWSTNAVPTAASDVTIPAGAPHQPALTATVNPVNSLAVSSGAILSMSGGQELRVNGDFNQLGDISVTGGTPSVFLLGSGRAAQGSSGASMVVEGTYTLTTALSLLGSANLTIQVAGQLTLNGQVLTIGGDFATSGSGHLIMTNAADSLVASGASFGSNAPGTISAGTIALSTHLNQTLVGGIGFAATGTNAVVFSGAGPASISFANSNPATGPNFLRHLRSLKTGGAITITGPLRITGDLDMTIGVGGVTGPNHTFVGGAIGLASGNPISLDTLSVGGTLSVTTPADYQVPLVRFVGLAGQTVPTNLFYQNMDFLAAVGLGGGFGMSGKLTIGASVALAGTVTTAQLLIDAGGLLDLNGNSVNDGGDLITQNGGQLKMASPNDVISVSGNASFNGGDETGLLTAGTVEVKGNFIQGAAGNPASFAASGAHLVDLQGAGSQTVSFAAPASSRFAELLVSGAGPIDIATQVNVSGTFSITSTATVGGSGALITPKVNAPNSSNLTVNTLTTNGDNLAVAGGYNVPNTQFTAGTTLPSLTYQNVQITIPGTMTVTGTIGFNGNLVIDQGILDVGGKILDIHGNLQTAAGGALKMASPSDSVVVHGQTIFGGASTAGLLTDGVIDVKQDFTQTAGSSPQSFAPSGSHLTAFTGGVPQAIDFVGGAPSGFHDLEISNSTAAVTLNSAVNAFGSVALNSGTLSGGSLTTPEIFSGESSTLQVGTLDMTGSQFFVGGPYDVGLTIFGGPSYPDSTTLPFAPYQNLQISLPADHVMFISGNLTVQNDLVIDGGNLNIGGSQLIVNGNFTTAGSGIFEMKNGSGNFEVDGKTLFGGGSTAGRLTDGFLDLRGDITQSSGNSASSFAAEGSHLTQINPTGTKTFFESPATGKSHFGNVQASGPGTWSIASSVVLAGTLVPFDGGAIGTTSSGSTITAGDAFGGSFTFDGVPLIIEDPFGFSSGFSGFSFINMSPSATQITIHSPSPGFNYSLDNITFTPLISGDTGLYIDAKDIDGPASGALTIEVTNSNQSPSVGGNGPAFTTTDGVATVSWQ